ncbi:MAG: hypothetical protein JWM40_2094 [Frankiales bacterium]|nr:hypothetical protein [Frankiales bacterium]
MGEDDRVEAAEQAQLRVRSRRQVTLLIVLLNLLILLVASTAVVDLRRLRTPEGVGLRWFQAAVFGDCKDYLAYSVADPESPDSRTEAQLCTDLRRHSPSSQGDSLKIGFRLGEIQGDRVHVLLTRAGTTKDLVMHVVWRAGHWRVARDAITCSSVGCA